MTLLIQANLYTKSWHVQKKNMTQEMIPVISHLLFIIYLLFICILYVYIYILYQGRIKQVGGPGPTLERGPL